MKKFLLGIIAAVSFTHATQAQGCAPKMVLIEMACAKLCGPCTYHLQDIKELYANHKSTIAMVYYAQAPIGLGSWGQTNMPYNGFHETFNVGYQSSTLVDRTYFPTNYHNQEGTDCEAVEDDELAYQTQMASTYVPVNVGINHTYNSSTREVNVDVTADFCEEANGDLRFYLVVVQDTVIGEGIDYAQNAMSEASATQMGYTDFLYDNGALWINKYPHIQVVKYQPSGFFGNEGIIASNVTAGQSFTENYTFTLPEFGAANCIVPLEPEHAEIIVAVVKEGPFGERQVLNANKVKVFDPAAGTNDITEQPFRFDVIGNPVVNQTLTLAWSVESGIKGDLLLFDASGKIINVLEEGVAIEGSFEKSYSLENTTAGIYFVGYKTTDGKQFTRKIIVE